MTDTANSNSSKNGLSRWDNEGGAQEDDTHNRPQDPQMNNAELVQLRVRVIALENIMLALLSESSAETQAKVRDMAELISPREGSTEHPLTIEAALHMNRFTDRAERLRRK